MRVRQDKQALASAGLARKLRPGRHLPRLCGAVHMHAVARNRDSGLVACKQAATDTLAPLRPSYQIDVARLEALFLLESRNSVASESRAFRIGALHGWQRLDSYQRIGRRVLP